jgi:hypothetical protein
LPDSRHYLISVYKAYVYIYLCTFLYVVLIFICSFYCPKRMMDDFCLVRLILQIFVLVVIIASCYFYIVTFFLTIVTMQNKHKLILMVAINKLKYLACMCIYFSFSGFVLLFCQIVALVAGTNLHGV